MAELKLKALDYTLAEIPEDGAKTFRFIASLEKTDRDGDIIRVAGIDMTEYMQNPVFLWGHDDRECPIGKCTGYNVEEINGVPALVVDVEMAETEDGAEAAYLYANGFLNAVSVRIMPGRAPGDMVPITGPAEGSITGWDIKRSIMLEISAVTIPANAGALIVKSFARNQLESNKVIEAGKELFSRLDEFADRLAKISKTLDAAGGSSGVISKEAAKRFADLADKFKSIKRR